MRAGHSAPAQCVCHGATVVMQVSGAVTAVAVRVLEHRIAEVIGSIGGHAPRVLLDLADVSSVDQAGVDMLLDLQGRIIGWGGEFTLRDPPARVVRLLHEAVSDPGSR